jgi:hypothetical protein
MPVTLTTAADPGDNDPGQSYPKCKVLHFNIDMLAKQINFTLGYGDVVDTSWVIGNGVRAKDFTIIGTDYDTMIAAASLADEAVYAGAKRVLYQWLIDEEHIVGTIDT